MNKFFFVFLFFAFFLDFSFGTALLGSDLSWPYFMLTFLVMIFFWNHKQREDILFGVLTALLLNIVLPLNLLEYLLIVSIIWLVIHFLRTVFFDDRLNRLKANVTFLMVFLLFILIFLLMQEAEDFFAKKDFFTWRGVAWKLFALRLLIGMGVFNLTFKLWPEEENSIKVLK